MNYPRLLLATLGGTIVYFLFGGLVFGVLPIPRNEYRKYPAVYRPQEEMKAVMPVGLAATLVGILVLAIIYGMLYRGGAGLVEGARFGILIGVFAVCAFVIHNYVNLRIGLKLTLEQAVAYFVEWALVGVVIGLIYRPAGP